MNTQIQNILSQSTTKTKKIQQLIFLGLTRTEISALVTNGNYGFVQNVYAKMQREGQLNQAAIITAAIEEVMTPRAFNKDFGVEFEACNVDMQTLRNTRSPERERV
jgi:hypothetical protein